MAEADILKVSILGKDSIHCGFHLIPYIAKTVISTLPSSTYILITDNNIAKLHLKAFEEGFQAALQDQKISGTQPRFLTFVIPPGETSKSRESKAQIEDFLLLNKCTRDAVVLALGGGVIGDLVGFVAATFMRGIRFVQIPTTLLAMVDSSIGGKTAIDTPHGKNLIGAFWQPEYIFIDAAFLETLPQREFSNGMAEVVKTAAIWNESDFLALEARSAEIFTAIQTASENYAGRTKNTRSAAQDLLLSVIVGSISVKAHIVTIDERETGLRNLVNFGHSIGHAIEAILTPTILHGECISVGMILEAELSRQMGILSQVGVGRLSRCLKAYNLPIALSDPRIANIPAACLLTVDHLLDIMRIDKKNSGPNKKIVILSRIGATYEPKATVVKDALIAKTLSEAAKVIPGVPSHNPVVMSTPGSKSISNRALVLAALGKGTCRLTNLLHSDDTQVMMSALKELKGAKFSWEDNGDTLVVEGGEGFLTVPPRGKELYLGNAGTAARFLATVCTLVQTSSEDDTGVTVITGNARMKQRPIGPLVTALRANGSNIDCLETDGCLPLAIAPEGLKGGTIQLAASVSSQYVSSILLCAPYAAKPVTLELIGGQVISQPYIDMTIAMMKTFGVDIVRRIDSATGKLLDIYDIPKAVYANPSAYSIESDASSATYPLAIAAITGTSCTINNIGTSSLQGDARFAKEVLEKMGCTVKQTEYQTTVQGPPIGSLKAIEEVDMETMTDAFLTATAVAAVSSGKTRILGIANQRVKECNRIRAMIDQLAKFGVECLELDDGLEIIGRPISELKRGVSVHCYDDHRVAMAFSVLGTVIEDTTLEEKRCVEKTWPNWWDDLENKIGIKVEGVDLVGLQAKASVSGIRSFDTSASVVLIGMRGVGKSFIGDIAAEVLGWPQLDADDYLADKMKQPLREFVAEYGWPAFREAEAQVLEELLKQKPTGHIISLGGGIVETPASRDVLKQYAATQGAVVHISRPLDEIIAYLGVENARPAYGEPVADVYHRRQPWFSEISNYEFFNPVGDTSVVTTPSAGIYEEVARFFKHITGQRPNLSSNVSSGKRSYFLSLTYPDVTQALPIIDQISEGVDALELRVDLLKSAQDAIDNIIPSVRYVAAQLATLRRATSLPIVYTVRTVSQGGKHPDRAINEALELLELGLRAGVEYLDVEITLPEQKVRELVAKKGFSKIIASYHDFSGNLKWNSSTVKEKYDIAQSIGDLIKIIGTANTVQDNFKLHEFITNVGVKPGAKPIIAVNMGTQGQLSRILNETFTPVTHPLLPFKAAPGQLSFKQIQEALHLVGELPSKQFYLFGKPIAHSMSPTLHNSGFQALGLPHSYRLLETQSFNEKNKEAITAGDFGGASVTIPYKLDVIPFLDELTPAAKVIGAVNTIIPRSSSEGKRMLVGDNTDWLGVRASVVAQLAAVSVKNALVIGGGGTARAALYALQSLGAETIYLWNRTKSKAQELATAFPDARIHVLDQLGVFPFAPPNVIVGTVPATATTLEKGTPGATFLTADLYRYRDGPAVVVDMAYKPADTPLLRLASVASNWKTVPGLEVLLEQGYEQFELWTGRKCPRGTVGEKVRAKYYST